jgi:hypothetical protein
MPCRPDPAQGKMSPAAPGCPAADRSTDGCGSGVQRGPTRVSVAGRVDGQRVSWSVSKGIRWTRGRIGVVAVSFDRTVHVCADSRLASVRCPTLARLGNGVWSGKTWRPGRPRVRSIETHDSGHVIRHYTARRASIDLIWPMAYAGFRFFGQMSVQFRIVRQRKSRYGSSRLSRRAPVAMSRESTMNR